METKEDIKSRHLSILVILLVGSLLLVLTSVYILKTLSIIYGLGVGGIVQSSTDNAPVSSVLQVYAGSLASIHTGILEAYVIFLISIGLAGAAFLMFIRRYDRNLGSLSRFTIAHASLTFVFVLLFFIILSDFSASFDTYYVYFAYAGIAICFLVDAYLELSIRRPSPKTAKARRTISIDPSTPYSNLVTLQDELFPNMYGHMRIVDKHFNSSALGNLHRAMEKSITNFTKITILTSGEMLDSDFNSNLSDFRNEITGAGIDLEVRLMEDKDAVAQHERLLLDDKNAYKIPPFNIINKRSEHITKINFDEANRRFMHLYGRAMKLENYSLKQSRGGKTGDGAPAT